MIVYKYDTETKEFLQELEINEQYGSNLPFTTTIKPLAKKEGFAICFDGTNWEYIEDNRNTVVYNKETKQESKISYLGKIKEDVTTLKPEQFDKWDYKTNSWVEDIEAKNKYELQIKLEESLKYLGDTDFYYPRYLETGEPVPTDVVIKRQEYRTFLRENENVR